MKQSITKTRLALTGFVRSVLVLGIALLVLAPIAEARPHRGAAQSDFGLGLQVGATTGLSAKFRTRTDMAVSAGLGSSYHHRSGRDGTNLYVDLLWHPAMLTENRSFSLPLFIGVGGRILSHDRFVIDDYEEDGTHVGVRVPMGLAMQFKRAPIDVFFQLAYVLDLIVDHDGICYRSNGTPYVCGDGHDTTALQGAIGVRYFF